MARDEVVAVDGLDDDDRPRRVLDLVVDVRRPGGLGDVLESVDVPAVEFAGLVGPRPEDQDRCGHHPHHDADPDERADRCDARPLH